MAKKPNFRCQAMPLFKKIALTLVFLLVAGVARMPLERPLGREMRASGILAEPLDAATSESLGQTSAAIALGGLRSLVAATLNFSQVVTAWQDQDWLSIFNTFKQIHTLQPQVSYYWEAAAGYAADDAYSDYRDRPGVPEAQRKLRRNEFFTKGISYLDEGIENIPDAIKLYEMKARMLSDTYKPEHIDYAAATQVLDEAVKQENKTDIVDRQRLYLMSRVPERRREALQLAKDIFATPEFRFPSVKSTLHALQNEFPEEATIPTTDIYASETDVIRSLFNYYQRRSEDLPMAGVRKELEERISPLKLPQALDPLRNPDIKRVTLKLADLMEYFPITLSDDPFGEASDWPIVIDHFQEYGDESVPTVRVLFFVLQKISGIDSAQHLPTSKIFPDELVKIRDLANFHLDESHDFPRQGVLEELESSLVSAGIPAELNPLVTRELFPLTRDWIKEVTKWSFEQAVK
jgi:hypothetical protein